MARSAALLFCLLFAIGCNTGERLTRLEKQTADMKAEIDKSKGVQDYDLEARCSKDAGKWFSANFGLSRAATLLHFTNHFNKASDQCFIVVEYDYRVDRHSAESELMYTTSMWNVYENSNLATFEQSEIMKPANPPQFSVVSCDVRGRECNSADQFRSMISPYMNQ